MIVETCSLLLLDEELGAALGLASTVRDLACEEEIVLVGCNRSCLGHILDLICLKRFFLDKWLSECLVYTTVTIQMTVIGPVEVLLLDRDVLHVDRRAAKFTLVQAITHQFDRVLTDQQQVPIDPSNGAFVTDIDIEQVMKLVQSETATEDVLNDGPVLLRFDLLTVYLCVVEFDFVLKDLVAVANVKELVLEIVGRVCRILQITN